MKSTFLASFFIVVFYSVINANAQIRVFSNGNTKIGGSGAPTEKLWIEGAVRISGWTDVIFDWTGKCCNSPVIYPETSWYLQLGKANRLIGTVYSSEIHSGTYYTTSDQRIKENIVSLDNVLEKIIKVSGYSYNLKETSFPANLPEEIKSKLTKTQIGFLAQELEKEFPELISLPDSSNPCYSVNYIGMIPVLLEAIKEQQKKLTYTETELLKLQNNTQQLERQLETYKELTDKLLSSLDNLTYNKTTQKSNGSVYQNTPNPFTENTEIRFELPSNANFSFLIIHDMQGKEIIS